MKGQLTDFIEKQGAVGGFLDITGFGGHRAG